MAAQEPRVEVLDPRGEGLVAPGAVPERVWTGAKWAEGPLILPGDGSLLFSDIPNNRILRWNGQRAEVWKQPSNFANGRTLDRDGSVLTCEHGGRRVTRTRADGTEEVVADRHQGRRLNSPNDVVVRASDGSIWFTDPPYGIESDYEGYKAPSEQDGNHVYRVDRTTGSVEAVIRDFDRPNGLAFSPDGRRLYVADSGASRGAAYGDEAFVPSRPHHIRAFDVAETGRLSGGEVFVEVDAGVPDGLRVDRGGRVWTSAWDGVRVHAPDGLMLLKVLLPEMASNLVLDEDGGRMFVTATTSVYRLALR